MSLRAKITQLEALAKSTTFPAERENALRAAERLRAKLPDEPQTSASKPWWAAYPVYSDAWTRDFVRSTLDELERERMRRDAKRIAREMCDAALAYLRDVGGHPIFELNRPEPQERAFHCQRPYNDKLTSMDIIQWAKREGWKGVAADARM